MSRSTKIFHVYQPKIFPRPTKNVIFLATFHKFLQFCLSNSDVSTTFGHFSQKSPLCRCGSYTHGSQRLMVSTEIIKNWGGGKMRGQKIILGGHLPPPPCPHLAPPLFISVHSLSVLRARMPVKLNFPKPQQRCLGETSVNFFCLCKHPFPGQLWRKQLRLCFQKNTIASGFDQDSTVYIIAIESRVRTYI